MPKVLVIFGTRPEAIKLCPVVLHLQQIAGEFETRVCVTAQHRALLDQVLATFAVRPDHDLDLMLPGQTLSQSTSRILSALEAVIDAERPDMILVQGDTTTTLAGALAGFYHHVPVGHVEAGLRTWDMQQPFPEEMNRTVTGRLAALHFPPTAQAADNLRREGVAESAMVVTGNTGVDALLLVRDGLEQGRLSAPAWDWRDASRKLILVTGHRRESFGNGFLQICDALRTIARRADVEVAYPVHPNPNVREPVERLLGGCANIHLLEPLDYVPFVDLMRRSHVILTDSGGVQEEAPSLGKPVLVMRDKTERPEAVEAGTSLLVGANAGAIVRETQRLLEDGCEYLRRSRIHNPYGDGLASQRIGQTLRRYFHLRQETLQSA